MERIVHTVYDCVDAYAKLLNIEYEILLGRKNQRVTLKIAFHKTDLHHLIGFHYLLDSPELNHDREKNLRCTAKTKNLEQTD